MRTITSLEEALALEDEILRASLADFVPEAFKIIDPGKLYEHNWHIDAICEYLQAVHKGEIRKLIVNMPPRSLKSICISICFPAWLLGNAPSSQIIVGSFSKDIAIKHSVDTRLLMESEWYRNLFPHTVIADDQNEKRKYQTTKRGHRISTSVGSNITGEGGDYLIVDDPLNPEKALSKVTREMANRWFDQTFVSRQNDKKSSKMIVVMQRLHQDDLTGHLMEQGDWEQLSLPVIAPQKTIISIGGKKWTREKGEILHQKREGKKEILDLRKSLGEYAFAGQYMQLPKPLGGGEFKKDWLQFYDHTDKRFSVSGMNIYILCDPAGEKKEESDWSAYIIIGLSEDNNYYILDILRDKLDPKQRVDKLFYMHMKWSKISGVAPKVAYEKYGMMNDTFYIKEKQKEINYRFPITEVGGNVLRKEDRIRQLIPLFSQGRIYLPEQLKYTDYSGERVDLVESFIEEEYLSFPSAVVHDDMLDAMARILDPKLSATFPKLNKNKVAYMTTRFDHDADLNDSWVNW